MDVVWGRFQSGQKAFPRLCLAKSKDGINWGKAKSGFG